MNAPRIASAIVSVVLAVLLILTIVPAFGPPEVVVPTDGVTDGGPQDDLPSLADSIGTLQARTALQRWRGVSGPSPKAGAPAAETAAEKNDAD